MFHFSAHYSSTPWRHTQQRESGMHTPSSRAASCPVSTSAKQFDAKGKTVSSNQSNSFAAASSRKTSKVECFKCGGHGHKQAKCPNRRAIIALADGSYESQSESEDEHNILALSNENLQTCEYQAEDGEYELGLNCLAIQSIPHVALDDIPQAVIPPNPEEITIVDFDDLLADINYLEAPISSQHGSAFGRATSYTMSAYPLNAPDHSLVVRRVLSTQLLAAEQGQHHNLF
jgi:hypothetical protein